MLWRIKENTKVLLDKRANDRKVNEKQELPDINKLDKRYSGQKIQWTKELMNKRSNSIKSYNFKRSSRKKDQIDGRSGGQNR